VDDASELSFFMEAVIASNGRKIPESESGVSELAHVCAPRYQKLIRILSPPFNLRSPVRTPTCITTIRGQLTIKLIEGRGRVLTSGDSC
jgi:hypothetical protein